MLGSPCSPCCGSCKPSDLSAFYSTLSAAGVTLTTSGTSVERGPATIVQNAYAFDSIGFMRDNGSAFVLKATSSPVGSWPMAFVSTLSEINSTYAQVVFAMTSGAFEALLKVRMTLGSDGLDFLTGQPGATAWPGTGCPVVVEFKFSQSVRTDAYTDASRLLGNPTQTTATVNGTACVMKSYGVALAESVFSSRSSAAYMIPGGWAEDKSVAGVAPDGGWLYKRDYWYQLNAAWSATLGGSQITLVGSAENSSSDVLPRFVQASTGNGWFGSLGQPTQISNVCAWSLSGTQQTTRFASLSPSGVDSGLTFTDIGDSATSSITPTIVVDYS